MELMKRYLEYIKESQEDVYTKFIKDLNNIDDFVVGIDFNSSNQPDFYISDKNNTRYIIETYSKRIRIKEFNKGNWTGEICIDTPTDTSTSYRFHNVAKILTKLLINCDEFTFIMKYKYENSEFMEMIQNIANSYEFQKEIIEEGELTKLANIKINTQILQEYPEIKDIKKQSEWS